MDVLDKSIALISLLFLLLTLLFEEAAAARTGRRRRQSEILHCQILEELPAGTLVGNIITDARLNLKYNGSELSKLRFSFLTQPDLDREYFAIETATGIITTTDRIDRDKLCPHTSQCFVKFDVAVRPVEFFQIVKVRVEVQDINDNSPYFPQSRIPHQISESTLPGTSFSIPAAMDPDSAANGVQRYELVSSSTKFELKVRETADGATDLRLVLMDQLDREKEAFYQVKIVAHDGGEPSKSGSVLIDISVLDANDNDPVFDNATYEVTVKENIPIGTTIFRVHARDPDQGPNGEIVYQLSRHTQQDYGDLFDIDSTTGEIFVKGPMDYENGAIYLLSVTAFDSGPDSLPAHATVVVRVQDMNDNAPQITVNTLTTSGDAQVAENTPPGTFVAHISIVDGDSDKNGKFTCSLSDSHFHLQKLYLTEYKIVTSAIFDRERMPYFDLSLECRDRGLPPQKSFAHIRVTILDDNDHTPEFSQSMYTATVVEKNLIGEFIVAVTANDQDIDTNGRIKYEVDEDARGLVAIDEDTGSITANVVFDHEDLSELQFHVVAKDQGTIARTATTKVLISIVDIDDEAPQFQQETYAFGTFENQPPNTEVGQVKAEDRDSEPYNHFFYALDPHRSPMDVFKIDPKTGKITTRRVLDREKKPVYYMVAVAASDDHSDSRQSSTVSVSVYVADKNDNPPVFDFPSHKNNSLRISNKVPVGQVITRLRAHDPDSGKNARLNYLITTGNSNNAFAIDPSTGAISVNKDLEVHDGDSFMLQVIVQDQGEPLLSALGELNIYVTKVAGYAKSRSMNLSKDNLIIVIVFVVVTVIISMVIIATIIVIKRRDTEQRHNHQNSKKELQRMLPPMEDVNGAPGNKVKASNAYVTAVEMDNLKSKNLTGDGGGENGSPNKVALQPNVNNRQRQEEVSTSSPTPPQPPKVPSSYQVSHSTERPSSVVGSSDVGGILPPPGALSPGSTTAVVDDDLPPPPDSWRFSMGRGSSTPCPSPVEPSAHPPIPTPPATHQQQHHQQQHQHYHPPHHHPTSSQSAATSSTPPNNITSTFISPNTNSTTVSSAAANTPGLYSKNRPAPPPPAPPDNHLLQQQHQHLHQEHPTVDVPSWGLPDLGDLDLEVNIAIHNIRGGDGLGLEEDAGSDNTTSSNSDSGRGPSSVEGDPNHKLSIDGLEENSTAAKQRLLQGLHSSSHSPRPPIRQPSPTSANTPLLGSNTNSLKRGDKVIRPTSPCSQRQPTEGGGGSGAVVIGGRLVSPTPQRADHRLHSPSRQERGGLVSPTTAGRLGLHNGGRTDQHPHSVPQRLSPGAPKAPPPGVVDQHSMMYGYGSGGVTGPRTAPKPSAATLAAAGVAASGGGVVGRGPPPGNKMVTFGDQPEVYDGRRYGPVGGMSGSTSATMLGSLGGGSAVPTPYASATLPAKPPMRIQRQYPPTFRSPSSASLSSASDPLGGLGLETGDNYLDRSRGDAEVDGAGDYVVYNYDTDDRETNV